MREMTRPSDDALRLFTREALGRYSQATDKKIQAGQARSAVGQLRDRDPPVVWQSDRGDYTFEYPAFMRWMEANFVD